jgi:hypothetical protein
MWWPLVFAYARKYKWLIAGALLAVSALGYIVHLRAERDELLLDKNNAEARADTLKLKYKNDSIVVVGILGFTRTQLSTLRDSLKLTGKTKTVTQLTVRPDASRHEHADQPVSADAEITLTDSVVGPPADIRATARLRALADSSVRADWTWNVRPSPMHLTVDVGCLAKYKPDVVIRGPSWARVENVQTEIARDVCGGNETKPRGLPWYAVRAGIVVGAWVAGRAHKPF